MALLPATSCSRAQAAPVTAEEDDVAVVVGHVPHKLGHSAWKALYTWTSNTSPQNVESCPHQTASGSPSHNLRHTLHICGHRSRKMKPISAEAQNNPDTATPRLEMSLHNGSMSASKPWHSGFVVVVMVVDVVQAGGPESQPCGSRISISP